jgi:hypothetical protein
VRLASRSCLTTAGISCRFNKSSENRPLELQDILHPLPHNYWKIVVWGLKALRLGLRSCLQPLVYIAMLTKAPSASSMNHMFPFLLPPKCNGLLYGIWTLLVQQVKHRVLRFCCRCAELRLCCTLTTQTFLWTSLGLEYVGSTDQWDPAWSTGCILPCTYDQSGLNKKKLLKCQQHRTGQLTLCCPDLTKHATATWKLQTAANFPASPWCWAYSTSGWVFATELQIQDSVEEHDINSPLQTPARSWRTLELDE